MSLTPIFDATLADAPVNIWEASNIFPRPAASPWAELNGRFDFVTGAFVPDKDIDWSKVPQQPIVAMTDPANLTFLRSADA